jgi:hypothetical protein
MAIEGLDVLYVPSRDVEADVTFYRDILGGRVIFGIEAMGTRVAEIALGPQGPHEHFAGRADSAETGGIIVRTLSAPDDL